MNPFRHLLKPLTAAALCLPLVLIESLFGDDYSVRDGAVKPLLLTSEKLGNLPIGVIRSPTPLFKTPSRRGASLKNLECCESLAFLRVPKRVAGWALIDVDGDQGWIPEAAAQWVFPEEIPATLQKLNVAQFRDGILNSQFEAEWGGLSDRLKNFYNPVKGNEAGALFDGLHRLTESGYIPHDYKTAKTKMYFEIDNKEGKVFEYYSGLYVNRGSNGFSEDGDPNGDGIPGDSINCEHTWPQSMFNKNEPMVADIHHLFPTFSVPNGRRGHLPFGVVEADEVVYSTLAPGGEVGSKLGTNDLFEPVDTHKGAVARSMLYFYVRYYNQGIKHGSFNEREFWDSRVPLFLEWNRQDPPEPMEKARNDKIEQFQGNRNPFVDLPSLADRIGTEIWRTR